MDIELKDLSIQEEVSLGKLQTAVERGINGITPLLRISTETNEWEVSYDEGKTWTSLGVKATGEKGDAGKIKFIVATELPTESIDENAIYMIPSADSEVPNMYDEYIYVNGEWECIGGAKVEIDLTDYVKQTDLIDYVGKAEYLFGNGAPTTATVAPFVGALYVDVSKYGSGAIKNEVYICTSIDTTDGQTTYAWSGLVPRKSPYQGVLHFWASNGVDGMWCSLQSNHASAAPNRYTMYLAEGDLRDTEPTGFLVCKTPVKDYCTVNKKYVDDLIAKLLARIEALEGNA